MGEVSESAAVLTASFHHGQALVKVEQPVTEYRGENLDDLFEQLRAEFDRRSLPVYVDCVIGLRRGPTWTKLGTVSLQTTFLVESGDWLRLMGAWRRLDGR